jgi:hypothetical protein
MCLETMEGKRISKNQNAARTNDGLDVWIRCFEIGVPVVYHLVPFLGDWSRERGGEFFVVLLLHSGHCFGVAELCQKRRTWVYRA